MIVKAILDFLLHGVLQANHWQIFLYTLIMTHITIAAVTIYLHRCQAHHALELHVIVSHFFRFWLWITTGMITKEWVAIHRKHHAKCETEEDPHSPQIKGISKVLLEGTELYRAESKKIETIEKYGHGTPNDGIERYVYSRYSWQGVGLMLIINITLFGIIGLTIWAIQMLWIPVTAAGMINGLGHYFGYRNYNCSDAATNISPLGIIIGGEELHNNHHTFITSAKLSSKWYEFDIGWMYICILEIFGLAKIKKIASTPKFDSKKLVIDFDTLQSVIINRYDVMAKYAKLLKHVWCEELLNLAEKTKLESRFLKLYIKFLEREPNKLEAKQKQLLSELFLHSKVLHTIHEMRIDLSTIWERSHLTREQLLCYLQDWCVRAETSGIHALHDFSLRLRSYA